MASLRSIAPLLALLTVLAGLAPWSGAHAAVDQRDVYYKYDLMGRQLEARFDSATGADKVTNAYDGFGGLTSSTLSMAGFSKTLSSDYDGAGRRTALTHPDAKVFTYAYDTPGRLTGVYEGAGTATVLDTFSYNADGTLAARSERAGSGVGYSWDDVGRLVGQSDSFTGGTGNVGWSFGFNPASQIVSEQRSNDAYAYGGLASVNWAYAVNGLNQYTSAGSASLSYDPNGNLSSDGSWSYSYDVENRLVEATSGTVTVELTHDPLGRLFRVVKTTGATVNADTRFLYDGDALVAEYNAAGAVTQRYVHGATAADDPLVWYPGAALTGEKWLHPDRQGSIVAITNSSGGSPSINAYDAYGVADANNSGRFQYTGQAWLAELGLYHYKASPYERGDRILVPAGVAEDGKPFLGHNFKATLRDLEARMRKAAGDLEFEAAARLRDEVKRLKLLDLEFANEVLTAPGEEVDRGAVKRVRAEHRQETAEAWRKGRR